MAVQEGPRKDNRFLMWAGHHSIRLMIPAVVLVVAFTVAGRPGGDSGPLSWVVTAVWLTWFVTIMVDFNYHEARLCERCIAATPLDPQKAVNRWDRVLRISHSKKALITMTFLVVVWFFTAPWITAEHHWWGNAINVAALLVVAVIVTTMHVHRRLYPWCPYCRWGGRGGQEEAVPDPDPAASAS